MGKKYYENYNRSYSSDEYRNSYRDKRPDKEFEQPISRLSIDEKELAEVEAAHKKSIDEFNKVIAETKRNIDNAYKKHTFKDDEESHGIGPLIFLIIFGLIFEFLANNSMEEVLPKIYQSIQDGSYKKKIVEFISGKTKKSSDESVVAKNALEAAKYGLQEQEYNALKDLDAAQILEKLEEGKLKKEEKGFLATKAVKADDAVCLRKIIDSGYDLNAVADGYEGLLFLAVRNNKENCIKYLVNSGADMKLETSDGDTVLHAAAITGNIDIAKRAIMAGVFVDKYGRDGKTPLFRAAQNNHSDMCIMLINAGAKFSKKYASAVKDPDLKNFFQTGKWSISSEFASNSKSQFRGNQGPDREVEARKKWEYVSRLIKEGRLSELQEEVPVVEDFEKMCKYQLPPACLAAKAGQIEILDYLRSAGCNLNEIDKSSGKNILHFAVESGNDEVVGYVLENTNVDIDSQDGFYNTALHYSVQLPLPYSTDRLLRSGANPNIVNLKLQTPLHVAAEKCNVLGCKQLLDNGVNINKQDYAGNTAFHYVAAKSNSKEMIQVFYCYEDKLDLTIKNKNGKTARESQRWDYLGFYDKNYR